MNFNSFIYKIPKRKLKKNITSLIFCGTHIYGSTDEVGIYKRKIKKKHDLDQENKKENKILIKKTRKKTRS